MTPLSVLGLNVFFSDLVNLSLFLSLSLLHSLSLSLSLFLILRFDCIELDFKEISYLVCSEYHFLSIKMALTINF